jgi:hypothetical protein
MLPDKNLCLTGLTAVENLIVTIGLVSLIFDYRLPAFVHSTPPWSGGVPDELGGDLQLPTLGLKTVGASSRFRRDGRR